jgi:hypothetical protein
VVVVMVARDEWVKHRGDEGVDDFAEAGEAAEEADKADGADGAEGVDAVAGVDDETAD